MNVIQEVVDRIPAVTGWSFWASRDSWGYANVRVVAHCNNPSKAYCIPCGKIEQDHQVIIEFEELLHVKKELQKAYIDVKVKSALYSLENHIQHEGMEFPWDGQLRGA